jgi:ribosomal protein S14
MSRMPQRCAQCGGSMQGGFLRDLKEHRAESTYWIAGPIERSFFLGVKVRGKPKGEVQALRCDACGRVDLYVPTLET